VCNAAHALIEPMFSAVWAFGVDTVAVRSSRREPLFCGGALCSLVVWLQLHCALLLRFIVSEVQRTMLHHDTHVVIFQAPPAAGATCTRRTPCLWREPTRAELTSLVSVHYLCAVFCTVTTPLLQEPHTRPPHHLSGLTCQS
jgi:hypothetical protein